MTLRKDLNKICTVGELKDWTKRHLWSKTTQNTGGMGGAKGGSSHLKNGDIFYYVPDTNGAEFEQFPIKWSENVLRNVLRFLGWPLAIHVSHLPRRT